MSVQIDPLIGMIILFATTIFLIIAIELKDLVKATIALGIGSALLASVFYILDAPYAAVFELSVAAGLVTILLLSAIGMIEKESAK
jgi:NADH-quinone oxidoreductase subunit J